MYKFSKRSLTRLESTHPDLQRLFHEVIKVTDCSVLSGYRGEEEQNKLVADGKSQLVYPKSKHNSLPSRAVDVVPYPIDWNDLDRFREFVNIVKDVAKKLNIEINCGADWTKFRDYPHFELK
jgi:peptidoglycan L-alanyl-D-glutamate endopeptidase CwlK